ncbi:hypothetical protein [Bordetella sp. LUAb4]|uniref:hypothetical protein n=1 Tax=Bordetella sp. LUAb4 TaxID=2843195 RepID=UPI001E3DC8E0|nr:hypothetical protein [Bordetella sp. LUAb4]
MAVAPMFDPKHIAEISSGQLSLAAPTAGCTPAFISFAAGPQEPGVAKHPRAAGARWNATPILKRVLALLVQAKESVVARYQSFRLNGKYSGSESVFDANILKAASAGTPSALQAVGADRMDAWARDKHPAMQRIIDAASYRVDADIRAFCQKAKEEHEAQLRQAVSKEMKAFESFMRTIVGSADPRASASVSVTLPENTSSADMDRAVEVAVHKAAQRIGYADRMKLVQAIGSGSVPGEFRHTLPIIKREMEENFAPLGDGRFETEELMQIVRKIDELKLKVDGLQDPLINANAAGDEPPQGAAGVLDDAKKEGRALLHALMVQLNLPAIDTLGDDPIQAAGTALIMQAAERKRVDSQRITEEAIELMAPFDAIRWLTRDEADKRSDGHRHVYILEGIATIYLREGPEFLKRCHSQIYDPLIESLDDCPRPGAVLLRDFLMETRNYLEVATLTPYSSQEAGMREIEALRTVLMKTFPLDMVIHSGAEGLALFDDFVQAFAAVRHLAQENGKLIAVLNSYGKEIAEIGIRSNALPAGQTRRALMTS